MRKILAVASIVATICFLSGCEEKNKKEEQYPYRTYRGNKWEMVRINDTIYVMFPHLNTSDNATPIILNTSNVHGTMQNDYMNGTYQQVGTGALY